MKAQCVLAALFVYTRTVGGNVRNRVCTAVVKIMTCVVRPRVLDKAEAVELGRLLHAYSNAVLTAPPASAITTIPPTFDCLLIDPQEEHTPATVEILLEIAVGALGAQPTRARPTCDPEDTPREKKEVSQLGRLVRTSMHTDALNRGTDAVGTLLHN